jgi:hypothetical protein
METPKAWLQLMPRQAVAQHCIWPAAVVMLFVQSVEAAMLRRIQK